MATTTSNSLQNCRCFTPSPMQYFQAYTGLQFSFRKNQQCKVYVPSYKNIFSVPNKEKTGTEMVFKDEYTSNTLLMDGSPENIDAVTLSELWNYANNNVLYDDIKGQLSFKDIEVEETTLYDFVKNIDTFLVYTKLVKFGEVWWVGRATTDLEGNNSRNVNVTIPNTSGYGFGQGGIDEQVTFWSPDKHINDEFKKYITDPVFYTGFLTSSDFINNNWFTIPNLKLSTKPFEKLKMAQILLNLNFVFDTAHIGNYYTIDSTIGTRIKDETSDTILDISQTKGNQNTGSYAETIINHWVGGLVSTSNLNALGPVGSYNAGCTTTPSTSDAYLSHSIAAQITLNPDSDSSVKELLNTIDPIHWTSSDNYKNSQTIGILNQDRAFGGASGNIKDGVVFGGIAKSDGSSPRMLDTLEIWSNLGFMRNIVTQANSPRSFHLQGGDGSTAAVVAGGYSDFNYNSIAQFSEYGKSQVRSDMEVFIKSQNPFISYFKKLPTIEFAVPRGDGAGVLNVSVQDRQDKFQVESALQSYVTSKEDEQKIAEYVENQAGTGNAKRFTIMNIDGFFYGGSRTGDSYLASTDVGTNLQSFERISVIYGSVGNDNTALFTGQCRETVVDVLSIDCKDGNGRVINLPKCGKYRVKYLNGAGRAGA